MEMGLKTHLCSLVQKDKTPSWGPDGETLNFSWDGLFKAAEKQKALQG